MHDGGRKELLHTDGYTLKLHIGRPENSSGHESLAEAREHAATSFRFVILQL